MLLAGGTLALASPAAHAAKKTVVLRGHICTKVATARHPVAVGRAGAVVCGLSGNDTLKAVGNGTVTLVAGPGHDRLIGSRSPRAHDVMIGSPTPGMDTFQTGGGDDTVDTAQGDTITCSASSSSITIAGDSQGDTENGDCQGGNVTDASQEWQGVVTATDGSTTMTVQWSDVNDNAQAWLDANGDPATATFDISTATINVENGGALATGDDVEVTANPSSPSNLAGSTLTAVSVDAQPGDQSGDGEGDGGGGGTTSACSGGQVTGTVSGDLFIRSGSCTISGATIQGDLAAGPGVTLVVQNSTVDGDVAAVGAASVSITGSNAQGDIKIAGTTGAVTVSSDTVQGDVGLWGNLGGVSVTGNTIGGDLSCQLDNPSPTGSGNTVSGGANGQCVGF